MGLFNPPKSSPPSDVALVVTRARQVLALTAKAVRYDRGMVEELAGNSPAMHALNVPLTKIPQEVTRRVLEFLPDYDA